MEEFYTLNKEQSLHGKWITIDAILPLLDRFRSIYKIEEIGISYQNNPIHTITLGKGSVKILLWTQMHGNESTATKVVFDLLNLFNATNCPDFGHKILNNCTLKIIPILNPDGAKAYTRFNAQQIDLNRDAVDLRAPESRLLRKTLSEFKPDFCFNLHDQRNIYSVGETKQPATISFLSPATEVTRRLTVSRIKAMSVISAMHDTIKADIPNNISRYSDEFYPNATGDNFQKEGYCTILIEAGHYPNDYDREQVRYYYFKALLSGLEAISEGVNDNVSLYESIPQNAANYLDYIYTNVNLKQADNSYKIISVGILLIETIENGKFVRNPTVEVMGNLSKYGANTIIDAKGIIINSKNKLLALLFKNN